MVGSVVRGLVFVAAATVSALAVWVTHLFVGRAIGPVGGVLAAIVTALMLGTVLWIGVVLVRGPGRGGSQA
jgi:hypothetical protein